MNLDESIDLDATPEEVFGFIDSLDRYPSWMRLVHSAVVSPSPDPDGRPAWDVELRAKVGPFARSKQLRMVRTEIDAPTLVRFERVETDGKEHARWALGVDLEDHGSASRASTRLTMHLAYSGSLWGGLLDSVLNNEIRQARAGLQEAIASAR